MTQITALPHFLELTRDVGMVVVYDLGDVIARMKCRMLVRKAGMGNATASRPAPSLATARVLRRG